MRKCVCGEWRVCVNAFRVKLLTLNPIKLYILVHRCKMCWSQIHPSIYPSIHRYIHPHTDTKYNQRPLSLFIVYSICMLQHVDLTSLPFRTFIDVREEGVPYMMLKVNFCSNFQNFDPRHFAFFG